MSEPDFEQQATELVLAIQFSGKPADWIKAAKDALHSAYREGAEHGKHQEKRRASQHGAVSHADWCSAEDCIGQCRVR